MFPVGYFPRRWFPEGYFGGVQTVTPTAASRCFSTIKERLVYIRPDGVRYPLYAPPTRTISAEEGFGTPPIEYITDTGPLQHGSTVRDFRLQPRTVQFVVMQNFTSRAEYRDGRAALLDVLRPNRTTDFATKGKLLYYLANGAKRQLDVMLESGPGFTPDQGGWRAWSFTEVLRFIAHDPLWYDPAQQSSTFATISPAELVFPATFPVLFGSLGAINNVTYTGTWLSYPTFVVTGPLSSFRVENTSTNKKIQLDYTLPAGYTMTITLNGQKTISRSDGVNLAGFLSPDSDLTTFALEPDPVVSGGVNALRVGGSGTSGASSVTMYWYVRFFGI